MEVFLLLNGLTIDALLDDQERLMLNLASGKTTRSALAEWLRAHVSPKP